MIVTCPQCQYENQVETTSTTSRVVCARCATMIPVAMPMLPKVPSLLEIDTPPAAAPVNNYAEAAPLDLDSLFAASPSAPPPPRAQNWEFDEVLDIPKTMPTSMPGEAALEIEEILSVSPRTAQTTQETKTFSTVEINGSAISEAPANLWAAQPEIPNVNNQWPEDVGQSGRPSTAFPQDSFQFSESTVVMTPPRRAKSNLSKVLVALLFIVGLVGVGYYLLGDLVKEWMREPSAPTVAKTNAPGNQKPAAVPNAAPGTSTKPNTDEKAVNNQTGAATNAPNTQAAPSQAPKPASSTASTPTPVPAKPTPSAPAPASSDAQLTGHSVGQSDGSLTVQLGSYNDLAQATARANKLKASGIEARVVKAQIPQRGTWYRVQAGRFTNQTEASKYVQELRAKGLGDPIVTGYQAQ